MQGMHCRPLCWMFHSGHKAYPARHIAGGPSNVFQSNLESMATMFPFLFPPSIESITAQTVYYQSITFLVFVLCTGIIFWMSVGSAGDRKHEDWRQCVSKFVFFKFFSLVFLSLARRSASDLWGMIMMYEPCRLFSRYHLCPWDSLVTHSQHSNSESRHSFVWENGNMANNFSHWILGLMIL